MRIARTDLEGTSVDVAPRLLGATLVHQSAQGRVAVRLTEVEAYLGSGDPGSHAFRGPTPRTAVMFGPAGHLYVYFTYGMHWCMNVVCGPAGQAAAVLLRAGTVIVGAELARSRRATARTDAELARGPARLCVALGIDGAHNGSDLCRPRSRVWLEPPTVVDGRRPVRTGPRVGVGGAGGDPDAFPWRYWVDADPTVSPYRPGRPPRPARPAPARPTGRTAPP